MNIINIRWKNPKEGMDLENERYRFVCDGRAVHRSVLVGVLVGGKKSSLQAAFV